MAHPTNLLPLKLLVISLGLVLIGGTVFVFTAIAHKMGSGMRACPDVTVHVADKGNVTGLSPQGDKIQVMLTSGGDAKVLTVDRCTGATQTVTVTP
jgi:hypothetical protein